MVRKELDGHLRNRLLASMAASDYALIERNLQSTLFEQGAVVQEVGESIERIYFPQTGMISLIVATIEGGGIEAATIGYEGAVGVHRGLGKRRAFTRAVIQIPGTLSHISAEKFERATSQSTSIKDLITKYTEVLWVEAKQIAACNAVHDADAPLARWLLQTQDRIPSVPSIALSRSSSRRCSAYDGRRSRWLHEGCRTPVSSDTAGTTLRSSTAKASKRPPASAIA
jgi:CRP-like cAMP-binding protein